MNLTKPEMNGPWTVCTRTKVYDNPWITVTHSDVLDPNGKTGIYGTVHFKNFALAILPIDHEGYTWLVGQHRFPFNQYSWEIPEGGGPLDQDPLESAKRELREETGLTARHWEKILELQLSNSVCNERAYAFIARDLTDGEWKPDSTEKLTLRRLPFETVFQMVVSGEIVDALSVATILRAKLLLT